MHPLALAAHVSVAHRRFSSPVQHIVVIVQENRSLDYLFNGFPGANTVTVDPYTGTPLQAVSMVTNCPLGATHGDFVADYDNGAMDGFARKGLPSGCTPYGYAPRSQTTRYWRLAANNVLADETFQSNQSNSFPSHQYLYAGRSCSYPADVFCMAENVNGFAYCGAPPSVKVAEIDMTSPYPGVESRQGRPCKAYANTIVDEAMQAGLSWHYYTYDTKSLWAGPSADANCWKKKACAANVTAPPRAVLRDIAAHQLANLVYVTPETDQSDHPDTMRKPRAGENWVASVVDAIGADPYYWTNTTVLLTWDDWGGWYDHEVPPQAPFYQDPFEFGFRVPLVVASAYVKPGTVDHTTRNVYGGMLRYVETTFGLASLQQVDAPNLTDDLSGLFDYAQPPNAFVPM
jgi:phospholipase C